MFLQEQGEIVLSSAREVPDSGTYSFSKFLLCACVVPYRECCDEQGAQGQAVRPSSYLGLSFMIGGFSHLVLGYQDGFLEKVMSLPTLNVGVNSFLRANILKINQNPVLGIPSNSIQRKLRD